MEHERSPHQPGKRSSVSSVISKIAQIIWLIVVAIVIFLVIRVVLSLVGANQDNDFASFIYNITFSFVEPFRGLLQVGEYQIGVSRLEFETIVAIFVYVLAGWGVTAAINVLRR
ncbi:MAG: YggT family protein [Chloroflexi bacterium]|nr:MAG: YggT family protein [Chloroflexota bacterium]